MKTFKDLKVGDEVFYVPSDTRSASPKYVTVTKVGRKFIHLNELMRMEEWGFNGYALGAVNEYPHGHVYATKERFLKMSDWDFAKNQVGHLGRNPKINESQKERIIEILKETIEFPYSKPETE